MSARMRSNEVGGPGRPATGPRAGANARLPASLETGTRSPDLSHWPTNACFPHPKHRCRTAAPRARAFETLIRAFYGIAALRGPSRRPLEKNRTLRSPLTASVRMPPNVAPAKAEPRAPGRWTKLQARLWRGEIRPGLIGTTGKIVGGPEPPSPTPSKSDSSQASPLLDPPSSRTRKGKMPGQSSPCSRLAGEQGEEARDEGARRRGFRNLRRFPRLSEPPSLFASLTGLPPARRLARGRCLALAGAERPVDREAGGGLRQNPCQRPWQLKTTSVASQRAFPEPKRGRTGFGNAISARSCRLRRRSLYPHASSGS